MDCVLYSDIYLFGNKEDFLKILKLFRDYTRNPNMHITSATVYCQRSFIITPRTSEATLEEIGDLFKPSKTEFRGDVVVAPPYMTVSFIEELSENDKSQSLKIYNDIMKLAPKVNFNAATTNIYEAKEHKQLEISYENGELTIKNLYLSTPELIENYVSEFPRVIPFETFKDIFKLEEDADEDGTMYEKFISEYIFPDIQLTKISREDFLDFWGYAFCRISDEDDFKQALEEYRKLPIPTAKGVKDKVLNLRPEDSKSILSEYIEFLEEEESAEKSKHVINPEEEGNFVEEIAEEIFPLPKGTPKGLKS